MDKVQAGGYAKRCMLKRLECIVCGDVQGVSYRAFVKETAREFGLVGFVRNLEDGAVEVVVEGEESDLRAFLLHLKEKHPFAKVEQIDERWRDATGTFADFRIAYS